MTFVWFYSSMPVFFLICCIFSVAWNLLGCFFLFLHKKFNTTSLLLSTYMIDIACYLICGFFLKALKIIFFYRLFGMLYKGPACTVHDSKEWLKVIWRLFERFIFRRCTVNKNFKWDLSSIHLHLAFAVFVLMLENCE